MKNLRCFLFAVIVCLNLLKLEGQSCNTLQVNFSVMGFADNATSVILNKGQSYTFKDLCCGLCELNYYTWFISPNSGGSAMGFTINGKAYNQVSGITTPNANINFSVPGIYTVKLEVRTDKTSVFWQCYPQIVTKTKTAYITVPYSTPVAQFKTNGTDVTNLNVAINNNVALSEYSQNIPSSWLWTITPAGGWSYASGNSTVQKPLIKFSSVGQYTVSLKATNPAGSNTITKTNHINVIAIAPVADFNANGSSESFVRIVQNTALVFNDLSTNSPASWLWSITPGTGWNYNTGSSTTANPTVRFTTVGVYTIALKVTNSGGNNTKTKTGYVIVTPPAPTVTQPPSYCSGELAVPLMASGANLKWYTAASGGTGSSTTPVPSTSVAGAKKYYVSQTINGYESPKALVTVLVNSIPAAPGVTSVINYCPGVSASALQAIGQNIKWYTSEIGGTPSSVAPIPNTNSIGTKSFYVSQTNSSNCEGPRSKIIVNIKSTLDPPKVSSPVNYCRNAPPEILTAGGIGLKWYTTSSGGNASTISPTPSTTTAGTVSYFVSQTSTGCPEGPRSEIKIITAATPVPMTPAVISPIGYLQGDTSTQLTATGNNLKWYATLMGGISEASLPAPSTENAATTNYYVSQTIEGCESNRAKISVVVNALRPAPKWEWGKVSPIIQPEVLGYGKDLATDRAGNTYITGQYKGTVYFGNSPLPYGWSGAIYIAKYNTSGTIAWAVGIAGGQFDGANATSIALDSAGNTYITGYFSGTIKFGETTYLTSSASTTGNNVFIAKYDGRGTIVWAKRGTSSVYANGNAVAVDKAGNVFLTGQFKTDVTFENTTLSSSFFLGAPYLVKYSAAGNLLWAKKDTSSTAYSGFALATDILGNCFVAGTNFIAKYNSAGAIQWNKKLVGTGYGLATDLQNRIIVTGTFGNKMFDGNGNAVWSNAIPGIGIAMDTSGNSYVTGLLTGIVYFGRYKLISAGLTDIYVVKYTPTGNVLWAQSLKGNSDNDFGRAIDLDRYNNCYITGSTTFLFKLGSGAPGGVKFSPNAGVVGTAVTIKGYNFFGVDTVKFNGVPAVSIIINSPEEIVAIVPPGASTGLITIKTAAGMVLSENVFTVYKQLPGKAPDWVWAQNAGKLMNDGNIGGYSIDMATDIAGNTYVTGYFYGTAAFGDTLLVNPGNNPSMFIAKYNSTGKLSWARLAGANTPSNLGVCYPEKIAIDASGNCYVTGPFFGLIKFGDSAAGFISLPRTNSSSSDSYIVKYDAAGNFKWVKVLGSGNWSEEPTAICTDNAGNIYISGTYSGYSQENGITRQAIIANKYLDYSTHGSPIAYLVKYNPQGIPQFVLTPGYVATSMKFDHNNIMQTSNASDIASYNTNGQLISSIKISNFYTNGAYLLGLSIDKANNRYITGIYGSLNTNNVIGTTNLGPYGNGDLFIAKYNASNNFEWVQVAGGPGKDVVTGIATDASGNSYITGYITDSATFGAANIKGIGKEVFVAKYNTLGDLEWVQNGGGALNDFADNIGIDASGNSYIIGTYNTSASFGSIDINTSNDDIYVAKLGALVNTSDSGYNNLCPWGDATLTTGISGNSYQWQVNNGTGFVSINNDSVHTGVYSRNLQLNKVPTSWYNYEYRCIVDGKIDQTILLKFTANWNGYINTSWGNANNWNCTGKLPDSNTDVYINSGNVIINSNVSVRSLTVRQGATISVLPGYTITIKGN